MAVIRKKRGGKIYLYEYRSIRENGKVKHKFVRYLGVEGNDGKPVKKPRRVLDKVELGSGKSYGAIAVLWKLTEELGFEEIIDKVVGERQGFSAGKLLTICAVNKCLDTRSLSKLHDWYKRTDLPFFTDYSPETISKNNVLSAMDTVCGLQDGEEYDLTLNIEKKFLEKIKDKLPQKFFDGMLYDLTANIYHGSKCLLAEVGHKTIGNNKTQINVALVVSRHYNLPLFHLVFKGSVRDVKTIGNLLHVLNQFGIKETTLIWDRGNTSVDTIRWAEEQGLNLIIGLRKDLLEVQKLFKDFPIEERYDTLVRKYDIGTIYAQNKVIKVFGQKRKVVIYMNTCVRDKTRTNRNEKIKLALGKLEALSKKNLTKGEFQRRIKKVISGMNNYIWTDLTPKGDGHYNLQYGTQEYSLEQVSFTDGKFALLSTDLTLNTEEIVNSYFGKNDIEQAFKIMKHVMDMSTVNHRLTHRVKCYMFICFLSYYLFSYLKHKLKEAGIEESVESILESLNEIEKVELKYGMQEQIRYLNLGSSQKDILKKLNLTSLCPQKIIDRTNV